MSFSNSSGGTLALPSPTHAHHIDVTSAVRTLRRSISRSPSKFLTRSNSQNSLSPESPHQTSPQSPCRRFGATPQNQQLLPSHTRSAPPHINGAPHSTAFTPFRPSVRLSLRSAKAGKTSPSRPLTRARASPKSPLKRALNMAPDSGNSLPAIPLASVIDASGQENNALGATSPISVSPVKRRSLTLDVAESSPASFLKSLDSNNDGQMVTNNGSLKRSDATMNLDQPSQGSPVAKRRSLHGISGLGQNEDQNIFGANTTSSQSFYIHEDSSTEYEIAGTSGSPFRDPVPSPTPATTNVPKRSSSLRKSTLQQRYGERGSWGRRSGERQLAQMSSEYSPVRSRPRLSLDQFVPPPVPQESPFVSTTPTSKPPPTTFFGDKAHQPHPLSKTLTTSSSGNSLTEEAPIYAPVARMPDRPRPHLFSRSLPLNATRPTRPNDMSKAMATPSNSQLWVGAFNSTGLISKVNRNPEEDADKKMAPPDTPCKKHSNPFATFPPPAGSAMKKRGNNRNSFGGLPSTPFGNSTGPNSFGRPGKGMSIFQRGSASRSARRGSVLSLDGDEHKLFGETIDFSTPMEGDAPPTPTKNTLTPSLSKVSEYSFESPHDNHSPTANRTLHSTTPVLGTSIPREATSSPLDGRRTPQTPRESLLPLDTSRLSISQIGDGFSDNMPPPVTPTAGRDLRSSTSLLVTPVNARTSNIDIDASLSSRFDKVEQIGKGEFSVVYRVTQADHQMTFGNLSTTPTTSPTKGRVYAVKKSKHAFQGPKDRDTKVREAEILRTLSFSEHVVQYFDHWDYNNHLYIQTEYCEEGTLDKFLGTVGRGGRLDDFRIFKILQDLCLGLKDIHDSGFMHLDLKPANILVTFEGVLKIGDFGLAQSCSSAEGVDVEGDREYMAPEMLKGKSCQSADVFSLGLIILETAANVVLPDNGPTWIALRSGDLSEVPSLTWNPSIEVQRDATGNPTEIMHSDDFTSGKTHDPSNLFGPSKRSELLQPPEFMVNATHSSSLDLIVRWMTAQEPSERPTVHQVLELEGLQWVGHHRAAPATVYEGNWGPDEELIPISIAEGGDSDTEMTDV
ncbi:wee/wee-unclassified protein kinase [Fusarium oxysporum f. sp. lycopersici 4287]|uniref:Wee/wee-unclassified protein kinase n=2 Tax=Fusarium oxysporum TaxID=5507 RepID=A0A0J9URD3_FUSO4|nr:wee/wee-unclassified protein kinase [Fusarium oxysporum f. sp. lycopersici 4287]EXK39044.1 WEE/WEE-UNCLASSIFIED protein kinase [Fusarium oxysporum f. sp. melonis 26406]KNB02114.1 wee/wee-unclassified protein kinase [Fusarium oxysporum f. sp. lycopersici 4287]